MKNSKLFFLLHPAGYPHFLKQWGQERNFQKSIDNIIAISKNRRNIAEFAEQVSGGKVESDQLLMDFAKIDDIYGLRSNARKPVDEKIMKLYGSKEFKASSKEEKKKALAPLMFEREAINNTYRAQAITATSMVAVDLYEQQGRIQPDKKGGLSVKGAAVIAVIVAGAGAGAYYFMKNGGIGGGDGRTEMEASDYAASMVGSFQISLNGNQAYAPGVDTSSPEFVQMINSPEYQSAVRNILAANQAEVDALQQSVNSQIMDEYKAIEAINTASGYKDEGYASNFGDFERVENSNGDYLESHISFLTRYKNYLEAQDPDHKYELVNNTYKDRLAAGYKDIFAAHNMDVDYENDGKIIQSCYGISISSNGTYYFDRGMAEGTDEDFYKDFYPYFQEHRSEITNIRTDISTNNENYQSYKGTTENLDTVNNAINNYYSKIDPSYADQIKTHIQNIDTLQADYATQAQDIQNNANLEVGNLQQTTLGISSTSSLDQSINDVFASSMQPTGNKSSALQNFVDSAIDAAKAIKDGAQDAITTIVDEITRCF